MYFLNVLNTVRKNYKKMYIIFSRYRYFYQYIIFYWKKFKHLKRLK